MLFFLKDDSWISWFFYKNCLVLRIKLPKCYFATKFYIWSTFNDLKMYHLIDNMLFVLFNNSQSLHIKSEKLSICQRWKSKNHVFGIQDDLKKIM